MFSALYSSRSSQVVSEVFVENNRSVVIVIMAAGRLLVFVLIVILITILLVGLVVVLVVILPQVPITIHQFEGVRVQLPPTSPVSVFRPRQRRDGDGRSIERRNHVMLHFGHFGGTACLAFENKSKRCQKQIQCT